MLWFIRNGVYVRSMCIVQSPRAEVDVLVIGGGAAGLSLGRRIALSNSGRRVLILDGRGDYTDDRTWSFWSNASHDMRHLIRHEWRQWRFDDGASLHDHGVAGQTYQTIRGLDFYNEARRVIARNRSVELKLGVKVTGLRAAQPDGSGARVAVETSEGPLIARHVIDTRPSSGPALLFQCFAGSEIDHGGLLPFRPDVAGVMTRMRVDEHGFAFTYVLPFTTTTALVEFTRFSRRALSPLQLAQERDAELRALGIGTSLTTVIRIHATETLQALGVPANDDGSPRFEIAACIPIGRPSGNFGVAPRKPASAVTHWNTFGDRRRD